jgi:hypothetical protein
MARVAKCVCVQVITSTHLRDEKHGESDFSASTILQLLEPVKLNMDFEVIEGGGQEPPPLLTRDAGVLVWLSVGGGSLCRYWSGPRFGESDRRMLV